MRIRINLNLDNVSLRINYLSYIQGFIYSTFPDNEETKLLHDQGLKYDNKKFKLFTFSEIYGSSTYDEVNKRLLFRGKGYFDFSAFDDKYVKYVMDYLDINNSIVLGEKIIKVINYEFLEELIINKDTITYLTQSPVVTYITDNKKMIYPKPGTIEYCELIYNNLKKKYYLCFHEELGALNFKFDNIKMKLSKFRNTYYESYHYNITIYGLNKKVQKVLLTCGLGGKNSMGFGMITNKTTN